MKIAQLKRFGIPAAAAGLLAVGGYFLGARGHADRTIPLAAAVASSAESADASHVTSTDEIEFPQSMWDSAGLRVARVETGPISEPVEITGKISLNEDRLAHIAPLVEGRVAEVKIQFGQRVKKGELLVMIQSKEVGQAMLQLFQDRSKLEFAESKDAWTQEAGKNVRSMIAMMREGAAVDEIEKALKDRTLGDDREKLMTAYVAHLKARTHFDRLSPLSQSGAVAARQLLDAESELNAARATVQSLWEQVAQDSLQASRTSAQSVTELRRSISAVETNLKILGFDEQGLTNINPEEQGERLAYYPVIAPFNGTVISKDVVLLERVAPDRQILTIADLSTVWVSADVFETQLPLVAQLGEQTIHLRTEAWPDRRFEAKVFYAGDVVQEATRTVALRAIADNADGLLKPGMFVTVELPNQHTEDVLCAPLAAIQEHQGTSFVFVQRGENSFARRDVVLGRRSRELVEVVVGLKPGDRVAVSGGFALKTKMLAELLAE